MEVEDLDRLGYVELDVMDHDNIMPFIRTYLGKSVASKWIFAIACFLPLGFAVVSIVGLHLRDKLPWGEGVNLLFLGIACAFLLIPVHECIHMLAYRSQGATRTSFGVDLKRFVFLALADRFVADRRAFRIVAAAPFVMITVCLLVPMAFVHAQAQLVLLGALSMHTACCSGDLGLLAYFDHHRGKDVVTYDDVAAKRSYFLAR